MADYNELARQMLEIIPKVKCITERNHANKVSRGEGFMLGALMLNGGSLTSGDLANEMGVSTARIAAICNAFESRGLIERKAVEGDRRKCRICITKAGENKAKEMYQEVIGVWENFLQKLGEEDAEHLIRIAEKALRIMEEKERQ